MLNSKQLIFNHYQHKRKLFILLECFTLTDNTLQIWNICNEIIYF